MSRILPRVPVVLFCLILIPAVFAPLFTRYEPLAQNVDERLAPPSADHVFGTDGFGRDVFARVLFGARISMYVGLLSVGSAAVAGLVLGTVAAYSGGLFDAVSGRLTDVLLGIPYMVLAVLIIVGLGSTPTTVAAAIAVVLTPRVVRLARASALSVLEEQFIEAARTAGAGARRIVFRHLLPNSIGPVLVQVPGYFGTALATEAVLSYLGLGVPPPYPSWGRMIQEGTQAYFEAAPWLVIFPGAALFITVISFAAAADLLGRGELTTG